jgi:CHAT domain-containing protein
LLIVADGALQFVPFAALPLPAVPPDNAAVYRPLITEHETVNLPSASTLAVLRQEIKERKPAAKILAVLADPVFMLNDTRFTTTTSVRARPDNVTAPQAAQRGLALNVTKAAADAGLTAEAGLRGIQIPRLPGTRREAEQILTLVPAASQMHVFDFAANRAAVTAAELGAYRYVHFATHGFLDSQHPELSGILLSMYDAQGVPQDGFLRAHEVFNLKLAADLVTLSACQTGLGKEIKGEGLVGLTRGFMYAGAPRVVVSLWNVSDEGTAELMTRFYRGLLQAGQRPAAALQAAQVSMLKEQKFAAPFYWAAFTLQGEWR